MADKTITKEIVISRLQEIIDPVSKQDLVKADLVSSIIIKENNIGFALKLDPNNDKYNQELKKKCESVLSEIKGVGKVTIVITSENSATQNVDNKVNFPIVRKIAGVKKTILVASGKGGVGKSSIAVNLAKKLNSQGFKVGLLDVDIYGPSVPKLLGLNEKPILDDNKKMLPLEKNGIKSMSIGYLVDAKNALVWRASMAIKSINQLILGSNWGDLDYLIIDTPPGTGDIHLSLCKNFLIDGAIIVTTPHDLSFIDVEKSVDMFRKLNIDILGLIENMSYFQDDSGKKNYIFGNSQAQEFCQRHNIELLDQIKIIHEFNNISFEKNNETNILNKTISRIKDQANDQN